MRSEPGNENGGKTKSAITMRGRIDRISKKVCNYCMKFRFLVLAVVFFAIFGLSDAYAQTIRIMPLGDSITKGSSSGVVPDTDPYQVSYRKALWDKLIAAGYTVDFVGSLNSGSAVFGSSDPADHEGHGGWCADGCYPNDIRDHVYDFLKNRPADVVLLHIGTNDIEGGHASSSEVNGILEEIYKYGDDYDREIWVVLALIIEQAAPCGEKCAAITNFNNAVYTMAQQRMQNGDRLVVVDMQDGAGIDYRLHSAGGDMWDTLHPYATGYTKMADVWFDALQQILPIPERTLTVQKSGVGEGVVTSVPDGIDCGSTCSDSFVYGTVITLTATPDHGSAFSEWVGCDSANGNTCTITMGSDRTATASFAVVTTVKLLSPGGGEIVPAGSQYLFSWEAPRDAVKYKLKGCSGWPIGTVTGTSVRVAAPLYRKNKTNCKARITAYDSANKKIGSDETDGFFTVEVANITFPGQGTICTSGQICAITWTKSENVPAASAELSYSTTNGSSWKKIPAILPGNGTTFNWVPPFVSGPQTKCKIRLILKDSNGKKVGTDVSDGVFTIQPCQ